MHKYPVRHSDMWLRALSLTIALGHLPHEICSLETMVLISNKYGLGQSQAITHSHINFPIATIGNYVFGP
jgi:hypothetical protein